MKEISSFSIKLYIYKSALGGHFKFIFNASFTNVILDKRLGLIS